MATPRPKEARRFYRVALQRRDDALLLLHELRRPAAAIYLGGYAVECALKSVILAHSTEERAAELLATAFRGRAGHSFDMLTRLLNEAGVRSWPPAVAKDLALLNSWTTDLRYHPGPGDYREAAAFVAAVERVVRWADGRV